MFLLHSLLAVMYHPLLIKNKILHILGLKPSDSLRVLMYHDIAPGEQAKFAAQIRWLARTWRFISVEKFAAMIRGSEPIQGRNLLLTFDDGFISNRLVADSILNPMGIRALFFVASDYIGMVDDNAQDSVIGCRFYPNTQKINRPKILQFMGWDDLKVLLKSGHCIGAHTRRHARLSDLESQTKLVEEIVSSADLLEFQLGAKVEHFSYPFAGLNSFSPEALSVARRRFSLIYSGMRGTNVNGTLPWAVRRDGVSPNDSLYLLGALLEGGVDFRYARDIRELEAWGRTSL